MCLGTGGFSALNAPVPKRLCSNYYIVLNFIYSLCYVILQCTPYYIEPHFIEAQRTLIFKWL